MEYKAWTTCFVILVQILTVDSFPGRSGCRRCKPGYYAHASCTDTKETVCRRCPEGHFLPEWNVLDHCYPCSKCGHGLFELKHCTRTSDVFCESCSSSEARGSPQYKMFCWGLDADAAEMLSDEPEKDGGKSERVLVDEGEKLLEIDESDDEGDIADDESSGQIDQEGDIVFKEALHEPLKATEIDKKGDDVEVHDISSVDLSEGSGYVLSEEEGEEMDEITELLAQSATVEPNEAREDELIPLGKAKVSPAPTEVELDVDEEGSGLVVEDMTNASMAEHVNVTEVPELTEDTSRLLVEIGYSGDGEDVAVLDNATRPADEIIILTKELSNNTVSLDNPLLEMEIDPDEPAEENKVEASVDEERVAQGSMDGRTRTAVIVGVAVGAVIFFALGFFASRHCKKRHAFKSMKKLDAGKDAKPQNGTPEAIEFRGGRSPGKYDPGSYERRSPLSSSPRTESVVLLSNKPLSAAPLSQDKHVNGIDKIKYMDETTDEETDSATPHDRLIREEDAPQNADGQKGANNLSNDVMNKFEDKLAPIEEERQPMLSKQPEDAEEDS
ncbi:uncharacterized protein LOC124271229 [Haliotis rubra]|uniref:uncharacterized protein LOC124271229 n=1 Tax=Haliotis rubra TaxID=36100 RepID=UPI001EE59F53|nr:uncharacterized protein LOC124271229 [Haliotis rubra]